MALSILIFILRKNPHIDVFVRAVGENFAITGCFALRYKYFKEMLENLDYKQMEANYIYLERKVMDYIHKIVRESSAKVMFVDQLDISAHVMGDGSYALVNL